jgi:hypothetical protein
LAKLSGDDPMTVTTFATSAICTLLSRVGAGL